jgi:hypothetical protein
MAVRIDYAANVFRSGNEARLGKRNVGVKSALSLPSRVGEQGGAFTNDQPEESMATATKQSSSRVIAANGKTSGKHTQIRVSPRIQSFQEREENLIEGSGCPQLVTNARGVQPGNRRTDYALRGLRC